MAGDRDRFIYGRDRRLFSLAKDLIGPLHQLDQIWRSNKPSGLSF